MLTTFFSVSFLHCPRLRYSKQKPINLKTNTDNHSNNINNAVRTNHHLMDHNYFEPRKCFHE